MSVVMHRLSNHVATKPMKVAILSFNFGQYCIRLADALGQEAEVLLMLPRELSASHVAHVKPAFTFRPFDHPRLRQPMQQMAMTWTLLRQIRRFDPDVIHFQAGHLWFNLAWPLLRDYPLVVTVHEARHHLGDKDSQRTPQAVMDFGYRRADKVIAHGEQIRQDIITHIHVPPERIHIVPAVPDIVLPAHASSHPEAHDSQCVLFFGRIWAYKGLEYLIRAEPLITSRVPQARIVIAGRGEDFARYRRMMVHPEHFIVHNEYIPDDKLINLFQNASVVVLPYVDGSISGVVPIACTFGKPVVATTVGILPEMVDDGQTGILVPPRDEKALAEAIVRLLMDKRWRDELGRAAALKAETTFSPAAVARQTLCVYARAIESATSRRRARHTVDMGT